MPQLTATTSRPDHRAALLLQPALATGAPVTRRQLNAAMIEGFGGTDADGHWTQRDSFEMLELATALFLKGVPFPLETLADVRRASELLARLPTQTVRGEEQLDWQQFSTPVDLAAMAVLLAAISPDDVLLEPSAGNGLLVVQAPVVAGLQLNEIDPDRRARLAAILPDIPATGHDGSMLGSALADAPRPTIARCDGDDGARVDHEIEPDRLAARFLPRRRAAGQRRVLRVASGRDRA